MRSATAARSASRVGIAGVQDAARRSTAQILDPGTPDPRLGFVAGTEEQAPRPNQGTGVALDQAASFALIRRAAEERRFVSYGDVAAASGMPWNAARRRMDPHLYALCRWATARGWPLLSAIVVDKPSVPHGVMRGRPLVGFARAAERCGRIVGGDAAAFLAEEQQRVFDWAEQERGHDLHA